MPKKDGGSASDLTVRDVFAMAALQGLLAASAGDIKKDERSVAWMQICGVDSEISQLDINSMSYTWGSMLAEECYQIADAMVKRR